MKRVKALVSLLLCAALMAPATTSAFAAADYTVQPQSAAHLTALSSAASGVLQKVLSVPATAQEPAAGETAESARDKEETLKAQEKAAAGKLPPQMGWSTWNFFREKINEEKAMDAAKALVNTNLNDHGYVYFNLDDCWQSNMRDENGRMQFDLTGFPSGPDFIKQVNALDPENPLKVGVYSSCGDLTCEDMPGAAGNEELDAQTFAEWGVEYLKYDYCHVVDMGSDIGYTSYTKAPDVDYITVAKAGTPEGEQLQAEDAILEGNAAVVNGGGCYGTGYVTGLSANGGSITFHKTVDEPGQYVLTIGFKKTASTTSKYAQIEVNGERTYETTIARTSGWSNTGRQQVYIDLDAGENTIKIFNPIDGQKADSIRRYSKMGNALKEATASVAEQTGAEEKPIFFSVCEHGRTSPWTWAGEFANSWRTSSDISASWNSVMNNYEIAVNLWSYQKPGTYNDPDMLEVGNGNLTETENQAHFSLWAMMNSPLILGCDIRDFVSETSPDGVDHEVHNGAYDIVTNDAVIALNQDPLLLQASRISTADGIDILVKPLENGEAAVCFFNKSAADGAAASVNLSTLADEDDRITLPSSSIYMVTDLWGDGTEEVSSETLSSGAIPAHGVKLYRVKAAEPGSIDKMASVQIRSDSSIYNAGETAAFDVKVENVGSETMKNISIALDAPESFTVTGGETIDELALGETKTVTFQVTMPEDASCSIDKPADDYILSATATYRYDGDSEDTATLDTETVRVSKAPENTVMKLGDYPWLSATVGWGDEPGRNVSIDGNPLRLGGETYASGIGVHAASEIQIYLGGGDYQFHSFIGVDQEMQVATSSIQFEVLADGERVYQSEVLNANDREEVNVVLNDCRVLTLRVTDAGDGIGSDHGDWADATVTKLEDVKTYNIEIADTENGTITTDPEGSVLDGLPVEITFTPAEGYVTYMAVVNGEIVLPVDNQYTLTNITEDVTISAEFVAEGGTGTQVAVVSAANPDAQEVDYGTAFEALDLPDTIALRLEDGLRATVPVVWDSESYEPYTSGEQTVSGELTLPACIVNTNDVKAAAVVTVGEETVRNIAPEGTAYAPDTALGNNKEASFVNDGIYDDQAPGADGKGVFGMKVLDQIPEEDRYVQVTWDTPKDVERMILWSYFAKDQGPKNFDVLVTKDGSSWETVANSGDITWKQNPADREQQQKEIVFDSVQEDILGLRIYVNSSYDANWGVNAVITELQIFGKNSSEEEKVSVNFTEPVNGKISAATDSGEIVAGQTVAVGTKVTFTFTPDAGYYVSRALINGEEVPLTAENTYTMEVTTDVTADAEFAEDVPVEHSLTVQYDGSKVNLSVDGEGQHIADLTGRYTDGVLSGTELDLTFAPAVDGREIAGVMVNNEAQAFDDPAEYVYSLTMPRADTELNFAFTVVNKMTLRQTIAIAEALQEGDEYANVIPSVKERFDAALEKANEAAANLTATQAEIDEAWSGLMDMIHLLSFAPGDKTELNTLLEIARALEEADFTPESWENYLPAYEAAEEVAADEEALAGDIEKACDALRDAFDQLVRATDFSMLQAVVDKANSLDLNLYIDDEAMAAFKDVLAEAEELLLNADAAQADVDAKAIELSDAMAALRKIPSKDELNKLIAETEAIDLNGYTDRSVATFKAALSVAKAVAADANADEQSVTSAYVNLEAAANGLVKAEKPSTGNNSSKGSTSANVGNAYGAAGVVSAAQGVTSQQAYVVSDTTVNFTLKRGSAYCFKMTVVNGNTLTPSFTVGNGDVLKTQFVAKIGNDYYYRVYATGTPGQSTGVYTTLPGNVPVKHCAVTIG